MLLVVKACVLSIILLNFAYADDDIKYEMFFDKLDLAKGKDILAASELKIEKTGKTNFIFSGIVEHFKEFNDDWTIALKISKSDTADGEYRSLIDYPITGKKGVCAALKNEYKKYFYDSIKDCSTAPHFDLCPLKEAKYSFDKCSFDASVFEKYLSKGYYIFKVFISHLEESDLVEYDLFAHLEDVK
ncbi:uncharacterized protein LOC129939003 [Eupeodes corollae]|uniref:uncharacterized protein LOC129939003 n=1 Tax=Eupeodes corollae TaxID=290404 RepID=UPI002490D917|nr:uncharacterized protein LOC129939003 [Eupeodes corollae]